MVPFPINVIYRTKTLRKSMKFIICPASSLTSGVLMYLFQIQIAFVALPTTLETVDSPHQNALAVVNILPPPERKYNVSAN